jgi:murein peptide amidase A
MGSASTKKLGRFVAGFWAANLLVVLLAVAGWLWMRSSAKTALPNPAMTASDLPNQTDLPTVQSTATPPATETPLPSLTPTPTLSPTPTNTPEPFSEGPMVIGTSVQERPLEVTRFGTGPTERLIVAGMHGGNEYNTVQLVEQLMEYLGKHPETVPENVTLYILHDLNPDGVARGLNSLGRANANGVDLNRNWPANWQKDWPRAGCWTNTYVTGGKGPGSEPETKALMNFIQSHSLDAIINYHSAALGIFPGGLPPDDYSIRLAEAVAAVTTYHYPPIDTGCDYTGAFTDWANDNNIAALDIELTNHTDTDFEMNLRVLDVFLNWKR